MSPHTKTVFMAFLVGVFVGLIPFFSHEFAHYVREISGSGESHARADVRYSLINPLLECVDRNELSAAASAGPMQSEVGAFVEAQKRNGEISFASVYYRDLSAGPWFGLNEDTQFHPASLLKVPLALTFYEKVEDDPGLLQKSITYSGGVSTEVQPYSPKVNLEEGKVYTLDEVLTTMLTESSNEAAQVLSDEVGTKALLATYENLGLTAPTLGRDYTIDVHSYAGFFRVLYNATYLSKKDSQQILDTLTHSSFVDGVVAGVPKGVKVAHKFGSREISATNYIKQLHDCGIVYAPGHPYLLCVMTQGRNFTGLANTIKGISSVVYQNVKALGGGRTLE